MLREPKLWITVSGCRDTASNNPPQIKIRQLSVQEHASFPSGEKDAVCYSGGAATDTQPDA